MTKILPTLMAAALLGLAPAVHALPTLSFSVDGGPTTTCADGAACDLNLLAGIVSTVKTLGAFTVNITTGLTKPAAPSPLLINLSSVDVDTSTGTHNLLINFSETGFVAMGSAFIGNFASALAAPAGSTATGSVYIDPANTLFATTNLIGSALTFGPGAFAAGFSGAGPGGTPYSLTEVINLSFTGRGTFSGDLLLAVPEPASAALAALGLIALGLGRRQRTERH